MKRSNFNLSHYHLLTADMGYLYPVGFYDVLPGDVFRNSINAMVRLQPMLAPVMHPIDVTFHSWFVPYRLIWEDFEKWIVAVDGSNYEFPTIILDENNAGNKSLADYFGVKPQKSGEAIQVSALPFRAYNLIYNEFYRDEQLAKERKVSFKSGKDEDTDLTIASVAWNKDYFTTARPSEQLGNSISIPVGSQRIVPDGPMTYSFLKSEPQKEAHIFFSGRKDCNSCEYGNILTEVKNADYPNSSDFFQYSKGLKLENNGTSISVEQLRVALALQRFQEVRNTRGSRYVEYLQSWGLTPSDARMNLPEYLAGGKKVLDISQVLGSSSDNLGSMGGHGLGLLNTNRFKKFFNEHGIILSFMKIQPRNMYQNAVHRSWFKRSPMDFYQKELANLGLQPVYKSEIYGTGLDVVRNSVDDVFGYSRRYDEYRRVDSQVHGDFRTTLQFWHLARNFEEKPVLNESFLYNEPSKRIFAAQKENAFLVMAQHNTKARRIVKKYVRPMTF